MKNKGVLYHPVIKFFNDPMLMKFRNYFFPIFVELLRHKVGAALVAVRRSGGVATFDALNHYINYAEMIMLISNKNNKS